MLRPQDTIVAVSSPPGRSLRGLIRISGPQVPGILSRLLTPPACDTQPLPTRPTPRRLTPCRIYVPQYSNSCDFPTKSLPLPGLLVYFTAPHSYTGQDVAEFQLPGNPALMDRLLHHITALGACLAEPGEFTYRAFLAGKLDLTQAEGIAATIAATSDRQLQAASMLRRGLLGEYAIGWLDQLAHLLALVEAGIDFTDQEDVTPIPPAALDDRLAELEVMLQQLLTHSRSWGQIESLPRVVLVGAPSVGKSTLFNALLGRQRSIISATPGTTRDVLAEPMTLTTAMGQPLEVLLTDLAGLDAGHTALDRDVQAAARGAIEQADLILFITDGQSGGSSLTFERATPLGTPCVRVRSKVDLENAMSVAVCNYDDPTVCDVAVSAHTGKGLDELRSLMAQRLADRAESQSAQGLVLQPRHEAALIGAHNHLRSVRALLAPQRMSPSLGQVELVADALRGAVDELAGLAGRVSRDDLLGRVFSTFCVGK